jgi:hypothetical protein
MTNHLGLGPNDPLPFPTDDTLQARFEAFHAENPWVLERLEHLTGEWLRTGHDRLGIGMLFEVLRWQHRLDTRGDKFKLNNSLRSRYARALIDRHPEWVDVIETRELRAA